MKGKIVLRTNSHLSYVGEIYSKIYEEQMGIMLKPSERSDIKIWIPKDEILCIIEMNSNIIEGEELENEFGL